MRWDLIILNKNTEVGTRTLNLCEGNPLRMPTPLPLDAPVTRTRLLFNLGPSATKGFRPSQVVALTRETMGEKETVVRIGINGLIKAQK